MEDPNFNNSMKRLAIMQAASLMLASHSVGSESRHVSVDESPETEREAWNRAVEERKAEKRARRAAAEIGKGGE